MEKHRINTTISAKHWEILKKHAEKYESQQRTLEIALESLENHLKQSPALSPEMQVWLSICELNNTCLLNKALFLELIRTADAERFNELLTTLKLAEYLVVIYQQKPLKECSLKEVMDGIDITGKALKFFDELKYTDDGNYYTLKVHHSVVIRGLEGSKSFKLFFESVFETYEVKTE